MKTYIPRLSDSIFSELKQVEEVTPTFASRPSVDPSTYANYTSIDVTVSFNLTIRFYYSQVKMSKCAYLRIIAIPVDGSGDNIFLKSKSIYK